MRYSRLHSMIVGLIACMASTVTYGATSASLSLVNTGSDTVYSGDAVALEVQATFDTRVSGVAFQLSATGDTAMSLVGRSLDPVGSNGLTYVSAISQDPFDGGLPHDLVASPVWEVAFDNDYGPAPGSANDGLAPGAGVVIETVTVRPVGVGTVTVSLSSPSAVHTTASPSGTIFDVTSVGVGSVVLTVLARPGDYDNDGDVDLDDYKGFSACMTGPENGPIAPGCETVDFDSDDDVDLQDYAEFQQAFVNPV